MAYIDKLKTAIKSPQLAFREVNRQYFKWTGNKDFNSEGTNVFEEEWDNLIILDACRYDLFERISNLNGDLSSKESRGSHTIEFLQGNFEGKDLTDTVYVTASPMLFRNKSKIIPEFHHIENVWMYNWDEKEQTVLPDVLTDMAQQLAEEYPRKRLIIHYLQPHYPFIESGFNFDKGQIEQTDNHSSFWKDILVGDLEIDEQQIWNAYENNLHLALKEVNRLLNSVDGKSVVTADHGNMIGERSFPLPVREYGHPLGIHTQELVTVPWLESPYSDRRVVEKGSKSESDELDTSQELTEKLQNLGYADV